MTYLQQELDDRVVLEPGAGVVANAAVIWLHGLGADGYDFVPIVPELKLPEGCAPRFVFPHAPERPVTLNNGMRMRAWYDIVGLSGTAVEDEKGIRQSAALVEQIILREREAGVAAGRIVLAGFSQGGAIALHTALRHPEPLAGVLALSAYLPLRAAIDEASSANGRVPILMCHGVDDPILPIEAAERSRDLLRARGYAVEWKPYPMQHRVCAEEIADISAWLGAVIRASEPATSG
jgi:phospholipase/carboxylesterase